MSARGDLSHWYRTMGLYHGCAPELIPETHTRQKYPTFVKRMGITRPPDTHLSWGGYKPIPTHTRVLVGYVSGIFQVTNTLYQVQGPLR